tara:strand:+ start:1009 stop:2349 length:1341 start_codon:yes stop_codon:yes gene_type:complete
MADIEKTVETKVQDVDINLDEIFSGAPGASSVTLPEETEKKPNVFSREGKVDMSFLNDNDTGKQEEPVIEEPKNDSTDLNEKSEKKVEATEEATEAKEGEEVKQTETPIAKDEIDELLAPETDEVIEEEPKKRGRKPITGMADVFNKLISEDKLVGFDDEKPLEEYSAKDFEELIAANLEERANAVRRETPAQFFNSLPQELQIAAKYVADGGQDMKGLFKALSHVEESYQRDIKNEKDQVHIIKEYLGATGYGSDSEIDEEIEIWKDLGKLEQQAAKFKPKLDKMQEKVVAAKLQEQEMKKKQQEQASQNYMKNVYDTLKGGKIGDLKVDKKIQSLIYNGLVNPAYPSISGENTNLLGHLLEKYQFVEPNYNLVSEALWLLADPNGYKAQIMKKGETKAVEKTVRKLKTTQTDKSASNTGRTTSSSSSKPATKRKISRGNIFKRF